jgi:hypothetical protein
MSASFPTPTAWWIARELFGQAMDKVGYTYKYFVSDKQVQAVVVAAVKEFIHKDIFFRVIGDKPMPYVTPPDLSELGKWLWNYVKTKTGKKPGAWDILERMRANAILKQGVRHAFMPEFLRCATVGV